LSAEPIRAVYASDLARARKTAEIVAAPHGIAVAPRPELREIHFGRFEGMTYGEILRADPKAARFWSGDDPALAFPGGESLGDLARRLDRFVEALRNNGPGDRILVVGHSGSLRVFLCRLAGWPLTCWWRVRLDVASLSVVEIGPGWAVIGRLNDTSHLGAAPRSATADDPFHPDAAGG